MLKTAYPVNVFVMTNGTTVVRVKRIIHDPVRKAFDSVIALNDILIGVIQTVLL